MEATADPAAERSAAPEAAPAGELFVVPRSGRAYSHVFLAFGIVMEFPILLVGLARVGILSSDRLRQARRFVILGIAILAAVATPTPDPFTMTLAMAPLIVLFELSILLARWIDRIKPPPDRVGRWDDDEDDGTLPNQEYQALQKAQPPTGCGRSSWSSPVPSR